MEKASTLCLCRRFHLYNVVAAVTLMLQLLSPPASSLSFNFYAISCPSAELIVKNNVRSASSVDPTIPGKLLRLLFHDCFVEGCDASILLQGNDTERSDPANKSVGGFSTVDSAKRVLEIFCPETVSCADIIALAARDAVEFAGGPSVAIPTGRRDGRVSLGKNVRPNIIDTSFTMDEMVKIFAAKGLSLDDLVTLSGAHTIGSAHCSAFSDRFQLASNGSFLPIDTALDQAYAADLARKCPSGASDAVTVNNDPVTPSFFDNQGLFQSDSALLRDKKAMAKVQDFAGDQNNFFTSWEQSFLKLVTIGVKAGDDGGEIRRSCSTRPPVPLQYAALVQPKVVRASVIVAIESSAEDAGGVVSDGGFDDPGTFNDPVHDLEPAIPVRVVSVDEPVEQRSRLERRVVARGEVEHGAVVLTPRDLEVHGEHERLPRLPLRLRSPQRVHDTVIGPGQDVVELRAGSEPVHPSRLQKPFPRWHFRLFSKIVRRSQMEKVSRRRRPAVGSVVQIHALQRSSANRLFLPVPANCRRRGGAVSGEFLLLFLLGRAHVFRQRR
nr:peroxidase 46-like [Ipomoea batatas]